MNPNYKVLLSTRMYTVLLASIVHSLPEFKRAKFDDDYAVEIEEMKNGIISPCAHTFPYRLGLGLDGMDQEIKQKLKNGVTDHLLASLSKADLLNKSEYDELLSQKSHWVHWLRRLYTHVDFVAKRHHPWRFQHPFFAPKKSISFFRPTPRGFSSWDTTTSPFVASRGVHIHPLFRAENCII